MYCNDGSTPNSLNQCADGTYASDTGSVDLQGNPAGGGGAGASLQSWLGTLSGIFGQVYSTVNPPPNVVAGRGIPGSPGSLRPVQQTGVSTVLVIAIVALLVWFGLRRR